MFDIQKQPGSAPLNSQPMANSMKYMPFSDQQIVFSTRPLRMKQESIKRQAKEMREKMRPNNYLDMIS